jgi:ornithine cyclodeaminase
MIFVSEAESSTLVDHELAFESAREAFASSVQSPPFPSLVVHGSQRHDLVAIKPAASPSVAGVKIGSYWPGNDKINLPRHNSVVLVFDQRTGRIGAVVEAGVANAYRTSAADALAVDLLARREARTLTVLGTGHQALYEVDAVLRRRSIEQVFVVGRSPDAERRFIDRLASVGVRAVAKPAEPACRLADIVLTVTTSREPLIESSWIRPGTHVSAMGADTPGKQELPAGLLDRARLFCDLVGQAQEFGEFQHADPGCVLTQLGDVLLGRSPGRQSEEDITVFDSSGIGQQDIALAAAILRRRGTPMDGSGSGDA